MGRFPAALEKLPSLKRSFESDTVGVFKVAAHRYPVSYAGYAHRAALEDLEKVMSGSFSFAARVGGYDDFIDIFGLEPGKQFAYSDLIGADSVERGQYTLEDMIAPFEGAGLLDGQEVGGTFHDADLSDIPGWIATNAANRLVCKMETD
jgi:hypothetical protein